MAPKSKKKVAKTAPRTRKAVRKMLKSTPKVEVLTKPDTLGKMAEGADAILGATLENGERDTPNRETAESYLGRLKRVETTPSLRVTSLRIENGHRVGEVSTSQAVEVKVDGAHFVNGAEIGALVNAIDSRVAKPVTR